MLQLEGGQETEKRQTERDKDSWGYQAEARVWGLGGREGDTMCSAGGTVHPKLCRMAGSQCLQRRACQHGGGEGKHVQQHSTSTG
jgi:hypothetical protein